jgi:hypothetical protein
MNRWRVGEDRGSKETDGCPLTADNTLHTRSLVLPLFRLCTQILMTQGLPLVSPDSHPSLRAITLNHRLRAIPSDSIRQPTLI